MSNNGARPLVVFTGRPHRSIDIAMPLAVVRPVFVALLVATTDLRAG